MLISPQGRVLGKMEGYQLRDTYIATVSRTNASYVATKEIQIAEAVRNEPVAKVIEPVAKVDAKPAEQPETKSASPKAAVAQAAPKPKERVIATAKTTEPKRTAEPKLAQKPAGVASVAKTTATKVAAKAAAAPEVQAPAEDLNEHIATSKQTAQAVHLNPPEATFAMDGYCPVTLWKTRKWSRGDAEHAFEYQGVTFRFVGQAEREEFKANPSRFAPQLLGCDPVLLSDSERAVPGSSRYGAYFDGELYLFESAQSRTRFRNDPPRFIRTRHVLNISQVQRK